jgi:hypothetical protein
MDELLFPELPESFDALNDDDLQALLSASLEAKDKIVAQDAEFLGDRTPAEVLAAMQAGVNGILRLKAEQATRVEATSNLAAELAALAAQVTDIPDPALSADPAEATDPPEDDPAEVPELDDTAATVETPELEPVVVASAAEKPLRRMPPAGRHASVAPQGLDGMVLQASAGLDGITEGAPLDPRDGPNSLNKALVEKIRRSVATAPGTSDTITVARADIRDKVPDFRRLNVSDPGELNDRKVEALIAAARAHGVGYDGGDWAEAEALTASGGLCAPVTPYYQLAFISTMQRPVRDSLVGFIADRGGIRFAPPPYLGQITTGVGTITAAQDAAGGSTATKTCQTLICPNFTEVDVASIFHCFTGGNLGQRAFPEQAAQFASLILAQHARVAETNLLNGIKSGSTAVTGISNAQLGAVASLLDDILTAAANIRSNNRMPQEARLQVILPAWVADVLVIDLIKSVFNRFTYNQAGVEQLLQSFNISVAWTLDGPTDGNGQVLARQAAGAMNALPTTIEWAIFPAGSWLFVDSGVLELGIVRDSVLNATNSYQVFGESWENVAGVGVESQWVTSTICISGSTAGGVDNHANCH